MKNGKKDGTSNTSDERLCGVNLNIEIVQKQPPHTPHG